ncbi:DUF2510 domain-containing protein [Homoserinimonas hongtaonis]|uniref:DUF2510 domain-containing protein n=1 Tax=Homoserinimonas hongtaonis TaxID=2079791 RepID=UPI001E655ED5|nr:DUF2510 domain-containing protein [Salinibacterium hongtaonis]
MTVPAGWYPDPMGLPQLRWWDNHSWTEFTSATRTPLIVQDEPRLAYADDSTRQTNGRSASEPPLTKAELISTLRQLEPPKPQQIERSHPAPSFAPDDSAAEDAARAAAAYAEQQAAQQAAAHASAQAAAQQRAAQQQAAAQAAQQAAAQAAAQQAAYQQQQQAAQQAAFQQGFAQQGYAQPGDPSQQGYAQPGFAPQQPRDPYDFVPGPTEEPRPARSSVNYSDGAGFAQPAADQARSRFQEPSQFYSHQEPFGRPEMSRAAQRRAMDRLQVIYTPWVWVIAMAPLLQLVISLIGVSSGATALPIAVPITILLLPYFATIGLAIVDRRALLRAGHKAPAHWAWAFATPIGYLIARSVATNREFGKGLTPVALWFAILVLQNLSIIAVPGIAISVIPEVFKAEVEQSIAQDAAIVGTTLDVECPAPAAQIGVQFTCVGTTETGNVVDINVSLQRSNGWIDWRVDSQIWQSGELSS